MIPTKSPPAKSEIGAINLASSQKTAKNCLASRVERWLLALSSQKKSGCGGLAAILLLAAQSRPRAQDFSLKTSFRP